MSTNTNKKLDPKTTKTEKTKIEINQIEEFEGDMKTNIISTVDMCQIISSLFSPVFSDYYACKININDGHGLPSVANSMPFGALYVDLFFKDQGKAESGIKNIELIGKTEDGEHLDLGARFQRVNGAISSGRTYNVTKQTYEALEDFMKLGSNTRWREHTQEIDSAMSVYGKSEAIVMISGLDLNKIIGAIYGTKSKEGRYEYIATPSTVIPGKNQEFIMQVCQLDVAAVRKLQNALGIYSNNAPMFHVYNK